MLTDVEAACLGKEAQYEYLPEAKVFRNKAKGPFLGLEIGSVFFPLSSTKLD